ncbi:uncharacterized protein [Penaeus vannamei]|uniref:uncharacterized protein isoform X2 n=1 Tax=Penaeus vannamei TaxID=6689 RepID=UPI00387F7AC3
MHLQRLTNTTTLPDESAVPGYAFGKKLLNEWRNKQRGEALDLRRDFATISSTPPLSPPGRPQPLFQAKTTPPYVRTGRRSHGKCDTIAIIWRRTSRYWASEIGIIDPRPRRLPGSPYQHLGLAEYMFFKAFPQTKKVNEIQPVGAV